MSEYLKYLINLHREGRIDHTAVNKSFKALNEPTAKYVTPVTKEESLVTKEQPALEKVCMRRRNKKIRRKQSHRYKENYKAVINELK